MNEPIRLRVKKALKESLLQIATTEGYWLQTKPEIAEKLTVSLDTTTIGNGDTTPAITIVESPEEKEYQEQPNDTTSRKRTCSFIIQGFADPSLASLVTGDSVSCMDIADWLRSDCKKRIAQELVKRQSPILPTTGYFGIPEISEAWFTGGSVRPPEQTGNAQGSPSRYAYFWFVLCLEIVEDDLDPYK